MSQMRQRINDANSEALKPYLTPPDVAKLLRVSNEKLLGWIRRGELTAVNVGNGNRPRFRISPESLNAFLKVREVQPPPKPLPRRHHAPKGGPLDPTVGKALLKKKQAVNVGGTFYRVWNGTILFF